MAGAQQQSCGIIAGAIPLNEAPPCGFFMTRLKWRRMVIDIAAKVVPDTNSEILQPGDITPTCFQPGKPAHRPVQSDGHHNGRQPDRTDAVKTEVAALV